MTFDRLILKVIWEWQEWRMRRQRERVMPELRELRLRRKRCQKQHRKGAAAIEREQCAIIHAALAGRR